MIEKSKLFIANMFLLGIVLNFVMLAACALYLVTRFLYMLWGFL